MVPLLPQILSKTVRLLHPNQIIVKMVLSSLPYLPIVMFLFYHFCQLDHLEVILEQIHVLQLTKLCQLSSDYSPKLFTFNFLLPCASTDDQIWSVGTVLSLETVPTDKIWLSVGLSVGKILLSNLHVFDQLCANLLNFGKLASTVATVASVL